MRFTLATDTPWPRCARVIAPGLLVQRVTHGIVHRHRSTFVPGMIERFGRQYRADRLHLALVGDALVDRSCVADLLSQRFCGGPEPGCASRRRRRRSDRGKSFQRLDDTRAIIQAVQDRHGLGEMLPAQGRNVPPRILPARFLSERFLFPTAFRARALHECLLVKLVCCSPLTSRVERDARWPRLKKSSLRSPVARERSTASRASASASG